MPCQERIFRPPMSIMWGLRDSALNHPLDTNSQFPSKPTGGQKRCLSFTSPSYPLNTQQVISAKCYLCVNSWGEGYPGSPGVSETKVDVNLHLHPEGNTAACPPRLPQENSTLTSLPGRPQKNSVLSSSCPSYAERIISFVSVFRILMFKLMHLLMLNAAFHPEHEEFFRSPE